MSHPTICFIGAGNMASAIIGGLLKQHAESATRIIATDPTADKRAQLAKDFGIRTESDNRVAVADSDIIVLAVKPQVLQAVLAEMAPALSHRPLLISIAAGIPMELIESWAGAGLPVIRCMPNTPALVGEGASVLCANAAVSAAQREQAEHLFQAVGACDWIDDEALMHGVTALSGSGPAYVFYMIEALQKAGQEQGLSAQLARRLAAQTLLGAAKMVQQSDVEPAQLKRNVMSPGGTTERGIAAMESHDFEQLIHEVIDAAAQRSVELGKLLQQDEA